MKNRLHFSALFFFILALFLSKAVFAEDGRRFIDEAAMPLTGLAPLDFVVPGWTIESTTEGDINNDGRSDVVVAFIESIPSSAPVTERSEKARYRALAVLMKTAEGGYHRFSVAKRLLRCSTCYGTLAGPDGGSPEIKLANGVITVEEVWGSRESVTTLLRFRFDKTSKRIVLIGEDIEVTDRVTGAVIISSSNYLTQIKIIEAQRYDEKQDRMLKIPPKKLRLNTVKRFIEDIDYEKY